MIIEIKEEDENNLKQTFLKIARYNKIKYGFDVHADIKCGGQDENVCLKINGIRV
jgi:hypothetical protein